MKKLLNILFMFMLINLFNAINLKANEVINENGSISMNEATSTSYEIVILNNIVNANDYINLEIRYIEDNSNQNISITHPSHLIEQTISVENGVSYLNVKNNHEPGEYTFDIIIQENGEINYSKELYIYSDGLVDCISITCIEECRDIYYTNFVASEEDLMILGKIEAPDDYIFTKTYYEVNTLYFSFIFEDDHITCDNEIMMDDGTDCITVTGSIKWKDRYWTEPEDTADDTENDEHIHSLVNNFVYLYDDDFFSKDLIDVTQTDEYGNFSFTIYNSTSYEDNGLDLFIAFSAENDACKVVEPLVKNTHKISVGRYINVENGSHITYDIVINKNDTVLTNAFEVSQMMIYPREYAYHMSSEYLPQIMVIYPNVMSGCFFSKSNNRIHMDRKSYYCWDVGMHEYGHYIDHLFGFSYMPVGEHSYTDDLVEDYGKEHGLQLAYSEAIATYIGLSTQLYFDMSSLEINNVGNFEYSSYDYEIYSLYTSIMGEINERSIASFLLMITEYTDSILESIENINLEYEQVWELLLGRKENFSEFLENFIFEYIHLLDDISDLLVYLNFSPKEFSSPDILDTNNENNVFSWEINYNSNDADSKMNKYSLIFYSSNRAQTYKIDNIKDNDLLDYNSLENEIEYRLTEEDFIEIMKLGGEVLDVQVVGYYDQSFETGPYYGKIESISKITVNTIVKDISYELSLQQNEITWFKFTAPEDGFYEFFSESYEDMYGELFYCIVPNNSINYLYEATYDQDYDDTHDFKIGVYLEHNQVVYLRVRDSFYSEVREYTLKVIDTHNCVYEWVPDGLNYHIYKCTCGRTEGSRVVHTADPDSTTIIGGVVYKRCKFCQALIKQNSSIITPVQGIKPKEEFLSE